MSARHRRRERERADYERQAGMLERFYRHGARWLFVRYLRETHLPRMIARTTTVGEPQGERHTILLENER